MHTATYQATYKESVAIATVKNKTLEDAKKQARYKAVIDSITKSGDTIQCRLLPVKQAFGYTQCAIIELQHADSREQWSAAGQYKFEQENNTTAKATPYTIVQVLANNQNKLPKNWEINLWEAATEALIAQKKVVVKEIAEESRAKDAA